MKLPAFCDLPPAYLHLAAQTIARLRAVIERGCPTVGADIRRWLTTQPR